MEKTTVDKNNVTGINAGLTVGEVKKLYACSTVRKDGVTYFRDNTGTIIPKPKQVYENEFDFAVDLLTSDKMFPELKRQLNKIVPVFTPYVGTFATGPAKVKGGTQYFLFLNPIFWNRLKETSIVDNGGKNNMWFKYILFVIIHELYHHIFGHMRLSKETLDAFTDHDRRNIAMDFTINGVIEDMYGLEGATKRIGGLINSKYTGRPWQEVYNEITIEELEQAKKQIQWQILTDEEVNRVLKKRKGKDPSIDVSTDGSTDSSRDPQKIKYEYTKDFKDGAADVANEIKAIRKSVVANNGTLKDLISELEKLANVYDVEIITEAVNYNAGNDTYDKGVRTLLAKTLQYLYDKMDSLDGGDGQFNNDEVEDDLEKIFQEETMGGDQKDEQDDDKKDKSSSKGDSGKGSSSKMSPEDRAEDAADEAENAADAAQDAATRAEQKAAETGDPSDEAASEAARDAANKAREAADRARAAADAVENGTTDPESGALEAEGAAQEAIDARDDALEAAKGAMSDDDGIGDGDDDGNMTKAEMEKALREAYGDGELDDNLGEMSDEEAEENEEDFAKHLDNMGKKDPDNHLPGTMKGNLGKHFPVRKMASELKWQDLLEDFIKNKDHNATKNTIKSTSLNNLPYPGAPIQLRSRSSARFTYSMKHIVIGLDNSGSVCSAGNVPGFLSELAGLIDNAIPEKCVIDVIQFEYGIVKCTRIVHEPGNTIDEVKAVASANGGGTDYYATMLTMSKLMDEWDTIKGTNDPVVDSVFTEEMSEEGELIQNAVCSIIFTDGDFFSGNKYYGIDPDKLLIIGIDCRGRVPRGNDIMFKDSFYGISSRYWKYDSDANVNESAINEGVFDDISDETISDMNKKLEKKNRNGEFEDIDVVALENYSNELCDFYGINKDCVSVVDGKIVIDCDVNITKWDGILFRNVVFNKNISYMGERSIHNDGNLSFSGTDSIPSNLVPKYVVIKGVVCFDGTDLTLSEIKDLGESLGIHNIKYVNCPEVTRELIDSSDRNPFSHFNAFTNEPALALPYIEKYIREACRKNKTDLTGFARFDINAIYDGDKTAIVSSLSIKNEQSEFIKNADYSNFVNGKGVDRVLGFAISLIPATPLPTHFTFRFIRTGALNSKEYNSQFGYDEKGFPPFVIFASTQKCGVTPPMGTTLQTAPILNYR